jgi:hypothetical protein
MEISAPRFGVVQEDQDENFLETSATWPPVYVKKPNK